MMQTSHTIHPTSSCDMCAIPDASIGLVVTSPPYPMIEMWDAILAGQDPATGAALDASDGPAAFEAMHRVLDRVWLECARVLVPGGFACINIGDATRKVGNNFRLYTNHSRITSFCESLGFQSLPAVLWRKQTNAPNKFMGSGMLPSGAYVTLEHEYILVFRKGDKRDFKGEEKERRQRSAYFWEERNVWFSDIWDFKGTRQEMGDKALRGRSGAFPFELAWRLIHMYSLQGDTVLDPFLGTGTTLAAAIAAGRSSVGYEIDRQLTGRIEANLTAFLQAGAARVRDRIDAHLRFISERRAAGKAIKYTNTPHGFPVMTRQEIGLELLTPVSVDLAGPLRALVTHERFGTGQGESECFLEQTDLF